MDSAWEIIKSYQPNWTKNTQVWTRLLSDKVVKLIACDKGLSEKSGRDEIYKCFVIDTENEYIEDEYPVDAALIEKENFKPLVL